ncbi:MAG: RNA polymerase sigma factor [bacterium]|nr:RNA polymerase sigma factor [bacterium]
MAEPELRTDVGFAKDYEAYVDLIFHICISYMKNKHDAEDIVQETFVRYIKSEKEFENEEHKKAWLIVTATNLCKDQLKHWWKKRTTYEEYQENTDGVSIDTTLMAVMELPDKYKTAVYLYYYQGYDSAEIASMLHKPNSTVRSYLSKARKLLKEKLGGDDL